MSRNHTKYIQICNIVTMQVLGRTFRAGLTYLVKVGTGNRIIFRKNETSDDGVVEEFYVDCDRGNNRVMMTTVAFKSKDEKIINRIFNYALTRINVLTKQNKKRTYDSYKHRLSTYVSWTLPAQRAHINVASGKDSNNSNTQTVIICKENYLGME